MLAHWKLSQPSEKTPSGVTEDLVCEVTSITKKGKSAWSPVTFNLYSNWANTVQGMLETAAASTSSVISVKLTFPLVDGDTTPDTVYFTCQVAKIGLTAGGSGDSHDMRPVELWIQSQDYTTVDAGIIKKSHAVLKRHALECGVLHYNQRL